jgi:hypothetical protein
VVHSLTRGLARRGHDLTVCTTDACDEAARLAPGARHLDGVHLEVFPNLSNHLAYHLQLFLPVGLEKYLRRHAGTFDVAHLHACRNLPRWRTISDGEGAPVFKHRMGLAPRTNDAGWPSTRLMSWRAEDPCAARRACWRSRTPSAAARELSPHPRSASSRIQWILDEFTRPIAAVSVNVSRFHPDLCDVSR